ncbi:MAG: [acyl-carrier-protein] S-malonyltransferase [Actinomycetota bacterium]|nr:[acyl-carrier-protein] S-malonyltransferase [Actinomycetota bacterium]
METTHPTYALVFPGQGSQFIGMADAWSTHPAGKRVLEEASDSLGSDIQAGSHDEDAMARTAFVQPALLACGVAAFEVLRAEGLSETAIVGVAGHSLGEFAALVAAGVLTLPQALEVVVIRGAAMQRAGEERPGTMSALLGVGTADAEALCDQTRQDEVLLVANQNSPAQVVISGSVPAIERAEALAKERKIRAIRLNVAGAFHSPLMEPAAEPIIATLGGFEFGMPRFPIAENVTGQLERDPAQLRELLGRHVLSPVLWESCARSLAAAGATTFVECGAGDVLTKLAKRVVPDARATAVGSPEAAQALIAEPAG